MNGPARIRVRTLFVLAFVVAMLVPAGFAHAATITVNDLTDDAADANPGDGTCEATLGQGDCTLRAAVQESNANDDTTDTISIPAGTVQLKLQNANNLPNENDAATGDLDLTDDLSDQQQDVTIVGAGADQTTIDATALGDRVFETLGHGTVTIKNLTITGGNTTADEGSGGSGAGFEANDVGVVALDHVTVTDNHADQTDAVCGGVNEDGGGKLTVTNSTISNNSSAFGGGVCENGGGTVDVSDSTMTGNTTQPVQTTFLAEGGGALENGGGSLTLTRSTITDNSASLGGGVAEDGGGSVVVTDSAISGNHTFPVPPPTDVAPSAADTSSPDNGSGGGLGEDGGGSVDVERTTISGNDAGRNGGGVYTDGGTTDFTIDNSTIAGNSAAEGGGGLQNVGGDVLTLTSDTFDGNAASQPQRDLQVDPRDAQQGTAGNLGICDGPAVESGCDGTINVRNTIVNAGSPGNCFVSAPPDEGMSSGGNNIDSGTSCGFAAAGDKASTDPKLGQLADNGGPTLTEALLAGSPAIDAGGGCPPPATDQRGISRPQGSACDIGAFEVPQTPTAQPQQQQPTPVIQNTPKSCTDTRRFTFTLHHARGQRVVEVKVFINGTLKLHKSGHNLKKVTIETLPQQKFTVRIDALENTGASLISTRKYDGCGKSKPKTRHHGSRHHHKHHHH